MKKVLLFGLLVIAGFSNVANAAPTSLSTTGSWQTATGTLSGLLGQSAPATWTYDTNIQPTLPLVLPSGGTISFPSFSAPTYGVTTTSGIFDGQNIGIDILDNSVAMLDDAHPDLIASMLAHDLDPFASGDVLIFSTEDDFQGVEYELEGIMIFEDNFFSGPVFILPSAETLLEQSLFTYASLTSYQLTALDFIETGFASYAQSPSAVPVPAAAFMFAPALLGFLGLRRKTKGAVV